MPPLPSSTQGTPSKQQGTASTSDGDVWIELFGTVKNLEEAVDLCMQAFGPDNPADKARTELSWTIISYGAVALHES